jgi:hypothetical protein
MLLGEFQALLAKLTQFPAIRHFPADPRQRCHVVCGCVHHLSLPLWSDRQQINPQLGGKPEFLLDRYIAIVSKRSWTISCRVVRAFCFHPGNKLFAQVFVNGESLLAGKRPSGWASRTSLMSNPCSSVVRKCLFSPRGSSYIGCAHWGPRFESRSSSTSHCRSPSAPAPTVLDRFVPTRHGQSAVC